VKEIPTPAGDVRIGFIGLVTENTPLSVTPSGIADLEFTALSTAARTSVAELKAAPLPPDAIVILVHEGGADPPDVADPQTPFGAFAAEIAATGDVAAIFSGHTHRTYIADVGGMPVVQTGSHNQNLARISLDFIVDGASHPSFSTASNAELIPLSEYPVAAGNAVVDEVAAIVDAARINAAAVGQQTVGTITADLNHTYHPTAESTLANLVADAQLLAARSHTAADLAPDIAFTNPGGVRTSITGGPGGAVTYAQVFETQPFANPLITVELTGAEVKAALEQQWPTGPASRDFYRLGIAGLSYLYDPTAEQGERITRVMIAGEPLDEHRTYRAVVNNFLAAGGDGFTVFAQAGGRVDIGLIDTDIFITHFENYSPISPDTRPRGIAATWISDPDKHYEPGAEIALDLGSLIFATDEPKPDEIRLALINIDSGVTVEVGTAAVDTTVAAEIREIGRSKVRIDVPDLEGLDADPQPWILRITDPVNNYDLDFDVHLVGPAAIPGAELPRTGASLELAGIGLLLMLAGGAAAMKSNRARPVSAGH
ncbi:MAG TPA: 5'-nucleotidase C-terminal domain-containing protein, partial [Actinomycetales bacterium]|nr:5'-nucleotidase C-terminal domain-containing protein [Actinomycetales bacterium]